MVEDAKVAGEGRQDSASSQVEAAFGAVEGAVGLGVDIVEIERMRKILKRSPAFARKVFSAEERRYCDATAQPAVHYATRFAAKEAVLKALGTGFSQGIGVRDVEVRRTSKGRPYAVLTGCAKQVAQALGVRELPLSLSYTHTDAVACAMAITEGSVRAQQERRDPMEELARQFKEARTMLDDLDAAAPAPAQPQVPDAHSEKPRDGCADPFEFRPVAKRLVSHGDDRDSQAEQRISSCGIRSDALGSRVLGIAVVLNSELCLLPIEVAKEIASIERLLFCCVERDEAVQRRLGESHSADFARERKCERNFRFGRRR